jgi:hypothetical protein
MSDDTDLSLLGQSGGPYFNHSSGQEVIVVLGSSWSGDNGHQTVWTTLATVNISRWEFEILFAFACQWSNC